MTNYFFYFLWPHLLLDDLFRKLFRKKVSFPEISSSKKIDLYKVLHPTETELRAKKRKDRIETIRILGVPFIIGTLVGFIAALTMHSYISYIIVSVIPFFGLCLFIAAYFDGDQDYNIFMSFCSFILSVIWGIGGVVGIVLCSLIFH